MEITVKRYKHYGIEMLEPVDALGQMVCAISKRKTLNKATLSILRDYGVKIVTEKAISETE